MLNPFRRLFKPESKSGLANPEPWLIELFGGTSAASGIVVTPRNAMTCAPVRAAVRAIAETVGQLPIHVYERQADGGKERAPEHPAYGLLHDSANEWTPASTLKEQVTQDALLYEGGYCFINRVEGRPVELMRLEPGCVTVLVDTRTGEPSYRYSVPNHAERIYSRQNIIHIPSPSLTGSSLIKDAREAIALALVMESYAARLFGNGARPSGMLSFKGNMSPDTLNKAKTAWQSAHSGKNSGGTAVLPGEAQWTPLTLNSVDAQFMEMRQFAVAEIARVFRVPPIFLQDYGRATWSNGQTMGGQFLTYCLMRWVKAWEGEIRLKLFTAEERKTFTAEFLTDDLLRADFDARMDGYTKAIAARILNPNEARAMENRPPYEGGDVFQNPHTTPGALQ